MSPRPSWKSLALVCGFALATLIAVDLLVRPLAPPHPLKEVEDALAEYRHSDPTILVIGSSHARTFDILGRQLAERTNGAQRVLSLPVEFGKLSSYAWVLEHKLKPLIEDTARRPSLQRFVLVTEWWDSCDPGKPAANIPARAWTLGDFVGSVLDDGLDDYNRNYLSNRWSRLFSQSSLVQDRGLLRIVSNLKDRVRPPGERVIQARFDNQVDLWQQMIDEGTSCLAGDKEMQALERMLDYFEKRGVETTLLLYPRMPVTLTEQAKQTTLKQYASIIESIADERGLHFIDTTTESPLTDDDFAGDFDHVLADGNERYSRWLLDGQMSYLLTDARKTP